MITAESFEAQLDDLLARICYKLQISQTQHKVAEDRYTAISRWLEADGSPLAAFWPAIYAQGSLRIGTTVRPIARQEYDLDLVCEMQIDWRMIRRPVFLLDMVETRLREDDTYRTMLERKNRCVRVKYANEFHLDILPACPDPEAGNGCVLVPDREANDWKGSNPKGYAQWFESRAELLAKRFVERVEPLPMPEPTEFKLPLKRVVQLIKRWRDVAYNESRDDAPISIVLTTLVASHYNGEPSVGLALTNCLARIVETLPPTGERLIVWNPTNPEEDLSERWDEKPAAYEAFVSGISSLNKRWQELQHYRGQKLTTTLEQLFGEDETRSALKEQAEYVTKARSDLQLGVARRTGLLVPISRPDSIPLRRNTFYGEPGLPS